MYVAGKHTKGIEIWSAVTGDHIQSITEGLETYTGFQFSPDAQRYGCSK